MPLAVVAVAAGLVASVVAVVARGVVGARDDSLWRARRWHVSRRLQRVARSSFVAGSVGAVMRSFLRRYDNPLFKAVNFATSSHYMSAA